MNELMKTTSNLGVILFFFLGWGGQQGRPFPGNKIMMVSNDCLWMWNCSCRPLKTKVQNKKFPLFLHLILIDRLRSQMLTNYHRDSGIGYPPSCFLCGWKARTFTLINDWRKD
jgi:hypothetical protein